MHVLAALDQSKFSTDALDYLSVLPCHGEIDLSLLTVAAPVPAYDLSGTDFAMNVPDLMSHELEAIQSALNERAAFARGEFRSLETLTAGGAPGNEIVRVANEKKSDLVVLGAVGHSAIARVLLGSVSDYVATHVERSTLVVRRPTNRQIEPDEPLSPPSRVLLAIGNADAGEELPNWIEALSLPTTTQVHLVHVMEMVQFYRRDLLHKASSYWMELRSKAAEQIERAEPRFHSLGFTTRSELIEAPHIGHALLEYAQREQCDLIITGDQRETLMERIILGSTSRHILRHADCSVLISRSTKG